VSAACIDSGRVFIILSLVVWFAIPKNRVTGELDAELGPTSSCLRDEFTVAIDQGRENAWVASFLPRWLFLKVRGLKIGVCA
jgi:hypothetical protein